MAKSTETTPADRPNDPDRLDGVAHPRETEAVLGHDVAEQAFLDAWTSGRRHHAWLLRGAPGIGKASFAYRIARFLLTQADGASGPSLFGDAPPPPTTLDAPNDHPAVRQIAAGSHPAMIELRRGWNEKTKTFRTTIPVDAVRRLIEFFQLSAAEGGHRVALIDPADDMNASAANALLKLIEEPPERTTFLLVAHAPGRLPATIRSRCRRLDFRAPPRDAATAAMSAAAPELPPADAARLLTLADDAPGEALRLFAIDGLETYEEIVGLLATLPTLERGRVYDLMTSAEKRGGVDRFAIVTRLLRVALERLARAGAGVSTAEAAPGEAQMLRRLSSTPAAAQRWAGVASEIADRTDAAQGLNLDPKRAILDMALYIEAEMQRHGRPAA